MKTISCSFILFFSTAFCSVAYSLDSKSADLKLFNKAVQMSTDGDWSGAEKIFRDVAQRNPGWPEPKNNLAIVLYNAGKLEQARQSLDDAVSSLPSFKVAQDNRQRLYDYSATMAYYKVVGIPEKPELPKLELLTQVLAQPSGMVTQVKPAVAQTAVNHNTDKNGADDLCGIEQQVYNNLLNELDFWSSVVEKHYLNQAESSDMVTQVKPAVVQSAVSLGKDKNCSDKLSDIELQINNSLQSWLESWSSADVNGYLSIYSTRFHPSEQGKSYQQWQSDRTNKLRFGKVVKVTADDVEVYVDSSRQQALAQFVQHYKSSTYQDKVIKQLELALEDGRWLIRSERVLQQLY